MKTTEMMIEEFQNARMLTEGFDADDFEEERYMYEDDNMVENVTMEEFIAVHGKPQDTEMTDFGEVLIWENYQAAKGQQRVNIKAMDFGHCIIMTVI